MPTYCYECSVCKERQEHFLGITSHPDEMPCECGGIAPMLFNWQGDSFMPGKERPFKLGPTSVPIGWERGNTGQAQEERYRKLINETAVQARKVDKQAIKGGIRHVASVPREIVRDRQKQFGKDYYNPSTQSAAAIKQKLKSDGVYFHKD